MRRVPPSLCPAMRPTRTSRCDPLVLENADMLLIAALDHFAANISCLLRRAAAFPSQGCVRDLLQVQTFSCGVWQTYFRQPSAGSSGSPPTGPGGSFQSVAGPMMTDSPRRAAPASPAGGGSPAAAAIPYTNLGGTFPAFLMGTAG